MESCFGVVGHGVVGSLFTELLSSHGARVVCYDVLLDRPDTAAPVRRSIEGHGGTACALHDLVAVSDCILSVVTTQAACGIAALAGPLLRQEQTFIDLNSTSPATKREIAASVRAASACFVEGVILGAVKPPRCPQILLGGETADSTAPLLQRYGLDARFYSVEIGRASAFKMIRSIFSKGMEAVLIETLVAAKRAGVLDEIWQEMCTTLTAPDVEDTLRGWIRSHAVSAGRRCHEMREVSRFVEEIDLDPILPPAIARLFARSCELGIAQEFARAPESFEEVIAYLEKCSEPTPSGAGHRPIEPGAAG